VATPNADPPPEQRAPTTGFGELVSELSATWQELIRARLSIATLELQRAAEAFTTMIGLAVAAGGLGVMTWVITLLLVFKWSVARGMTWLPAGILVLALNLAALALVVTALRRVAQKLRFPHTLREPDALQPERGAL